MKLYSDKMEIQILELPKIPEGYQDPDGIVAWMKFFRGPDKKEMEELAKENPYLEEAYEDLLEMSQDEEKGANMKRGNGRSATMSISNMRQSVQQSAHSRRDTKKECARESRREFNREYSREYSREFNREFNRH